jgi:hypothetical protein
MGEERQITSSELKTRDSRARNVMPLKSFASNNLSPDVYMLAGTDRDMTL